MATTYLLLLNDTATGDTLAAANWNKMADAQDRAGLMQYELFDGGRDTGWGIASGTSTVTSGQGQVGPAWCVTGVSQAISGLLNSSTNYIFARTDAGSPASGTVDFVARATSTAITNNDGATLAVLLGKGAYVATTGFTSVTSNIRQHWASPQIVDVREKTAAYTSLASDDLILNDSSGGAYTLALPPANGIRGKVISVKLATAGNSLTLDPNASETIDGNATDVLSVVGDHRGLVSDGSNWHIVSRQAGSLTFVGEEGMVFGNFWGNDIAWGNGGPAGGTFTIISDSDITAGELRGTTFQNDQELLIGQAGRYHVTYAVSGEVAGTGKHIETGIGIDGTVTAAGRIHVHAANPNAEHAMGGTAILDLAAAEKVSVMIANNDDTAAITVQHVLLTIVQIGG